MSTFGKTLSLTGELRSAEDLIIEGHVDGPVTCEGRVVVVNAGAAVIGSVIGRDVTILGRVDGQIIATEVVQLRPGSTVAGDVVSPRFILDPEARFEGRVEPQHLEAALRVARYHQKKRDDAAGSAGRIVEPAPVR